jgi:hypothetical protein
MEHVILSPPRRAKNLVGFSLARKEILRFAQDDTSCLPYHPVLRSRRSGLSDSIKAIFLCRSQPLICFSRPMAARMSPNSSKYASRFRLYLQVKPARSFRLCWRTRRVRLLVTPV